MDGAAAHNQSLRAIQRARYQEYIDAAGCIEEDIAVCVAFKSVHSPLSYLIVQVCSITPLVRHADTLVKISRKLLGDTITFGVMRHTFMKQFCAGETENDLWPAMKFLRDNGIGAIIDYAGVHRINSCVSRFHHHLFS